MAEIQTRCISGPEGEVHFHFLSKPFFLVEKNVNLLRSYVFLWVGERVGELPSWELIYPIKSHFRVDDFPAFPRCDMWSFFLEGLTKTDWKILSAEAVKIIYKFPPPVLEGKKKQYTSCEGENLQGPGLGSCFFFPETLDQFEDCEWGQWTSWSDPNDKGGEQISPKKPRQRKKNVGWINKKKTDMIWYIYIYI